jgi:hypothetical protein
MTVEASIDGLDLLRAINDTQARGREGARVDPLRAAQEAGLTAGSERYRYALHYLIDEAALLGDEHTATKAGPHQSSGYSLYFLTRRAIKLLEES